MPSATRISCLMVLGLVGITRLTAAQDAQPILWRPVDQTVSDLDLRAASSRYVEQGIGVFGQSGSLYRRTDTGPGWLNPGESLSQQYQLRQPGYTAWIDRPDYLVIDQTGEMRRNAAPSADGHYLNLIPPNTVFDLVPLSQAPVVSYPTYYETVGYNTRLEMRIDGMVHGEVTGSPIAPSLMLPPKAHRLPAHLIKQRQERANGALETAADQDDATPTSPPEPDETRDDSEPRADTDE